MKRLIVIALLPLFVSCTSETQYGKCIGIFDDKDPTKIYRPNTKNVIIGVIFFELVIPPIVVALDQALCPIGDKNVR